MNDEFEFELELEQQTRQGQNGDGILDVTDTLAQRQAASEDGFESIFDSEGVGGIEVESDINDPEGTVSVGGPTEMGTADEVVEQSGLNTVADETVPQEELNELVVNVTEFGADESVLGSDRLLEAFREAEVSDRKGGSYVEGFTSAVQRMMGIKLDNDPVENEGPKVSGAAQSDDSEGAKERFQHHKEKYDAQFETAMPWPRDTMTAYHRMAMTYNAYVAGEKINGMEVTKVDVFLSGVRFYQSNIFETAIIRSLRFAGDLIKEKYSEDKVETDQTHTETEQVKETNLKDDLGAFDHGDATAVSDEAVKNIRGSIKEYGLDYGIDTTRGLDRSSTDNVRIFRPSDYVGRVDIGPDKTAAIPGVRLVEIDGNRALVTPDGKVVHESTRFQVSEGLREVDYARIESRCDVFRSPQIQEQMIRMADSRGMSVDALKAEYAEKAMDAYASRIEKSMLGEADRLERQTIPEAREELNSLKEDLLKLDRIDVSLGEKGVDTEKGISRTEISELRTQLQNGIETLEARITAMESRVDLLRDTHAQVDSSSVKDRFERAANTEEQAVGRAGRIEYISSDVDKRLIDLIDIGTERVEGLVERFNDANPDSQLTYDADTGELYNHFGVSDKGEFNPEFAAEGVVLPEDNPEAIRDYVNEHISDDFSDFDRFVSTADNPELLEVGPAEVENITASDEGIAQMQPQIAKDESEETEARVLGGQDDDLSGVAGEKGSEVVHAETGDDEYSNKIEQLLADYLSDTEGTVSLQEDVQSPLADLTHDAGKTDFRDAMDILTDMVKGIDNMQPEQLERIADLVHAIADMSSIPADAIDFFQDGIQGLDFAEELIAEIGKPEITPLDMEIAGDVQVTIGGEDLTVGENGLHDAVTGDPVGGLPDDETASQYLEGTERALYDAPADVESNADDIEIGQNGLQNKLESLQDTFDEIGGGAVTSDEKIADTLGGIEAGAESAGVEVAETAGGIAATEAAIEAGVAGSAAFL